MLPNALEQHKSDSYNDCYNACVKLNAMAALSFRRLDQQELVMHNINNASTNEFIKINFSEMVTHLNH